MICVGFALGVKHQGYKLEFSEDEETLTARMFSLVGERFVLCLPKLFMGKLELLEVKYLFYIVMCLNGTGGL